MARATAAANILPECLIQKILSYLTFKEAAKVSILSKTWLQAWLTLPYLELAYWRKETYIVDKIMERYKDNKIPIEKIELSNLLKSVSVTLIDKWIDKWLDIALKNGVKDLVYKQISSILPTYTFPIFKILAANCVGELVLGGHLMLVSLSSGVINCHSLRKLSLFYVSLDENMLQTLLTSCPLIDTLIIKYCSRLEKIELLNLQKIKSVSIGTERIQHVKIQAHTLEHLSYRGRWEYIDMLDIVECQNLKSLELSCYIREGFLEHLIPRYQFLERLVLNYISNGYKRLNICGSQLKFLKINQCEGIVEINAPNLVSLDYSGDHKFLELKIPSQLKHSKISLNHCINLNVEWICKLRKILSNSTSWTQVSLYFLEHNEINMKDLQLHYTVAIPKVDVLDVEIVSSVTCGECPTFVDALLWSCHPKRLNLSSSVKVITCFIDRLTYMKNSNHSTSHGSKPWDSQLKEVKAYTCDCNNQPLQFRSGELAVRTLTEKQNVYFLLDW